jgi:hypothetical protein
MPSYLKNLATCSDAIRSIRETISANIVFLGQIPAPTFHERQRAIKFKGRLVENYASVGTTGGYQNLIGIIRGRKSDLPPMISIPEYREKFASSPQTPSPPLAPEGKTA